MTTPPRRLVVLEDRRLDAMAADPGLAAEFACLQALRAAPAPAAGCRKCARRARDAAAYNAAKACLAGMPQADRDRLKARLGATTVRVVVALGGQVKTVDF